MQEEEVDKLFEFAFILHCKKGRNAELADSLRSAITSYDSNWDIELLVVKHEFFSLSLNQLICKDVFFLVLLLKLIRVSVEDISLGDDLSQFLHLQLVALLQLADVLEVTSPEVEIEIAVNE
jgi:hypothetical protein